MVDQVVDGHANDADQPGHNPGPKQKASFWPETFAVHMPTRDGQSVPVGAVYQGVVGGSHVYALMTTAAGPAPDPVKALQKTILCDSTNGDKISVVMDISNPAAPITYYFNINTAQPWTGNVDDLEACPDSDTESDYVEMCDGGVTFLRWAVKTNGNPTGEKYDTDKAMQPYTVTNESAVTVGKCETSCAKAPQGVVTSWAA